MSAPLPGELTTSALRAIIQDYEDRFRLLAKDMERVHAEMSVFSDGSKPVLDPQNKAPAKTKNCSQKVGSELGRKSSKTNKKGKSKPDSNRVPSNHKHSTPEVNWASIIDMGETGSSSEKAFAQRLAHETQKWEAEVHSRLAEELGRKYLVYESTIQQLQADRAGLEEDYGLLCEEASQSRYIADRTAEMQGLLQEKDAKLKRVEQQISLLKTGSTSTTTVSTPSTQTTLMFLEKESRNLERANESIKQQIERDGSRQVDENDTRTERDEEEIQSLRGQIAILENAAVDSAEDVALREQMFREQDFLKRAGEELRQGEDQRQELYALVDELKSQQRDWRKGNLQESCAKVAISEKFKMGESSILRSISEWLIEENTAMAMDSKELEMRMEDIDKLEAELHKYHQDFELRQEDVKEVQEQERLCRGYLEQLAELYWAYLSRLIDEAKANANSLETRVQTKDSAVEQFREAYFAVKSQELDEYENGSRLNFTPLKKFDEG